MLFIKQESLVLGSLAPELALLEEHPVILTPHLLETATSDEERTILLSGVFNGGIAGFADREQTRSLLRWWQERLVRDCVLDVARGMHYEQRWLDLAPTLFGGVHALRDPAVNIGHWNAHQREAWIDRCRLFRFSGFDPERMDVATRYFPDRSVPPAALPLFARFAQALLDAGWEEAQRWPYAYDRFDDGVPIPALARTLFRAQPRSRFDDPFATGPGSFAAWLREPPTGGGPPPLWAAVLADRPDVRAAFPDPAGADRLGFAEWAARHGTREYAIDPALAPTS